MKKRYILITLIFMLFILTGINNKTYAADWDEIENYVITVEPRMNDGTLDITYEVTWKVLDSETEGPLEWVKIGTPNSNFDNATALTKNIKSIKKYNGSYVRIDFNKKYYQGETVTFKYSIHQSYMYTLSGSKCKYEFTPAWFTDAKVDNLTIRWNKGDVSNSNKNKVEGNYLVWNEKNIEKGGKVTAKVEYKKTAFTALDENKQKKNANGMNTIIVIFVIIFIIGIALTILGVILGGGYYGHRGFYGGYYHHHYHHGCVRSSCACACAHSCACACAGSGRAGCSKKDFYGTKLTTEKMKKVLKK